MKKYLVLCMIISLIFSMNSLVTANEYLEGVVAGEEKAENEHSSWLYWGLGIPAAYISPLVVGGISITVANFNVPEPSKNMIENLSPDYSSDYIEGFKRGYKKKAKSKNVHAAWGATATAFLINLAVNEGEDSEQAPAVPALSFKF